MLSLPRDLGAERNGKIAAKLPSLSMEGNFGTEFRGATFDDNSVPPWSRGDFRGV